MLPTTFALLGAVALILGLLALWQSLRHAFGAQADVASWTSSSETMERQALLDEKRSLLDSIKDLEFEHQVGKINDKDYERLDRQLRARAREVLRLLDQDIGPFRKRAEALVRKHLEKKVGSTPYRDASERKEANIRTCAECGTVNDVDAKFCKECAHRFDDAGGGSAAKGKKKKKAAERKGEPEAKVAEETAESESAAEDSPESEPEAAEDSPESEPEGDADDAEEEKR